MKGNGFGNGFVEFFGSLAAVSAAAVGIASAATTGAWIPMSAGFLAGSLAAGTYAFDQHRTFAEQKAELIEELERLKIQLREQRNELEENIHNRQSLTTKLAMYLEGRDPSLLEIPIVRDRVIFLVAKVATLDKQIAALTQQNAALTQQNADMKEQLSDRQKLIEELAEAQKTVNRTETEIEREIQLRVLLTLNENSQIAVAKAVEAKVLQLQKAQNDITKLQEQLADNDATFEDLQKQAIPTIKQSFDSVVDARNFKLMELAGQNELLQQRIAELEAPRLFPGLTNIDAAGNRIIHHFAENGMVFDALEAIMIRGGCQLRFRCDRSPELSKITVEELNKISLQIGLKGLSTEDLQFQIDPLNLIVWVKLYFEKKPAQISITTDSATGIRNDSGDLLKPRFYPGGYSIEGEIANNLLGLIFDELGIPLACEGIKNSGGDTTIGLGYSAGSDPAEICKAINNKSRDFNETLQLASIGLAKKLDYADLISLTFRREPKAEKAKVQRLAEFDFGKITKKIIQQLETKPTLRITGATGDGKGVVARAVLAAVCSECEGWVIRLHDPQHGSAEDHWGIPKVSKSGKQLKANLAGVVTQMESRERGFNMTPTTFDIFDEVDTQLSNEDKEQFPIMLSRMRHLNMKTCVIGQNPKVARGGLQWSDMGQVIGCYLGSGCLDVIGAHPHLKRKAEELSEQYYELSEWCEFENRKLPVESRYLFGLLVIPGNKPQWFVLPPANQIVIEAGNNTIANTMELTNSNLQNKQAKSADHKPSKSLHNYSLVQNADGVQTQSEQELHDLIDQPFRSGMGFLIDQADQADLPKCRIHPEAELRTCKDGRYYCPSCKKVLGRNGLA